MKNIKPSLIRTCILAVVIILLVSLSATSPAQTTGDQKAAGEWKTVEDVFGFPGANLPGGVIRFNMPRKDLHVIVAGTEVKPGLALGAWAAFHHVGDNDAMVMGDLVLTEDEVAPVMKALQDGGVEITALHNHFNGESPKIMYLHMGGHGDPVKKAQASRVDRAPKLDGTLDDPAWQQTSPITNFLQREPFEGQAPTEKTEVRILYSKHEVYFGIRCFDSDPKKIVATELRRRCQPRIG